MVGELDIIGGDQRKVEYYVGLIVSRWHRHVKVQVCRLPIGIVLLDVLVLFCNGNHHASLEQIAGSHWEKARYVVWIDGFHVVLLSFSHIWGLGY